MRSPDEIPARYHERHGSDLGFIPWPCVLWNTREGHDQNIAELNEKWPDWIHEWREILPGDIDYPKEERTG